MGGKRDHRLNMGLMLTWTWQVNTWWCVKAITNPCLSCTICKVQITVDNIQPTVVCARRKSSRENLVPFKAHVSPLNRPQVCTRFQAAERPNMNYNIPQSIRSCQDYGFAMTVGRVSLGLVIVLRMRTTTWTYGMRFSAPSSNLWQCFSRGIVGSSWRFWHVTWADGIIVTIIAPSPALPNWVSMEHTATSDWLLYSSFETDNFENGR